MQKTALVIHPGGPEARSVVMTDADYLRYHTKRVNVRRMNDPITSLKVRNPDLINNRLITVTQFFLNLLGKFMFMYYICTKTK